MATTQTDTSVPFVSLDSSPKATEESSAQNANDTGAEGEGGAKTAGASATQGLLNFLKGMFGAGILAIPSSFNKTGIPAGILLYLLVGLTCTVAMLALIYIKHELQRRQEEYDALEKDAVGMYSDQQGEQGNNRETRAFSVSGVPQQGREQDRRRLQKEHPHLNDGSFSPREAMRTISAGTGTSSGKGTQPDNDHRPLSSLNSIKHEWTNGENQSLLESLETASAGTLQSDEFQIETAPEEADEIGGQLDEEHKIQTYAEVGEAAMGVWGRYLVEFNVVVLEWAFCAGFVNVGFANVHNAIHRANELNGNGEVMGQPNRMIVGVIAAPILIILSWIKKVKDLWIISLMGLVVYVFGVMGISFYQGGQHIHDGSTGISHDELLNGTIGVSSIGERILHYTAFIGSSVYSLEGINLVLPIETSLRDKKKAPLVIGGGTVVYCCMVCLLGSFGFAAGLGKGKEGVVTDNLTGIPGIIVSTALVLALIFTHALTLFPATEIVERRLFDPDDDSFKTLWFQRLIRALQVIFTVIVGLSARSFDRFSALIGALFMSTVGFLMPALFTWVSFNGNQVWPFSKIFGSSDIIDEERDRAADPFSFLEHEDLSDLGSEKRGADKTSEHEIPSVGDLRSYTPEQRVENQPRVHHSPDPADRRKFMSFDPSLIEPKLKERSASMSGAVIHPGKLRPLSPGPCMGPWGVAACIYGMLFGVFTMVFGLYTSIKGFMGKD
eukprot:gb/GECG01016314.1/.p1 GENE.gb/GECG01016314.1/~~gb/GECG01016314.1/.p1  ORF type:complete len:725 (+),score=95.54 gb/GECG01016314.1/:1-2175(+)